MKMTINREKLIANLAEVSAHHACVPDALLTLGAALYTKTMREVVAQHGATEQLARLVEASKKDEAVRDVVRDIALWLAQELRELGEHALKGGGK